VTQSKTLAVLSVVLLAVAGWIYVGLLASEPASGAGEALGPGASFIDRLAPGPGTAHAILEAVCRPSLDASAHAGIGGAAADLILVFVMWSGMALAMMLPTIVPAVITYAQIAESARRQGEHVAPSQLFVAGYGLVWLGFAAAASLLQWVLTRAALLDPGTASASGIFSAAVFLGAGVYQLSALKQACVTVCQRPFPFFFANWTTSMAGLFRLGVRHGVYCLGCCWAMMLVMFAVGVMNLVWMAALGATMAMEKISSTTRFSRAIGLILLGIGLSIAVSSLLTYWPFGAGQMRSAVT